MVRPAAMHTLILTYSSLGDWASIAWTAWTDEALTWEMVEPRPETVDWAAVIDPARASSVASGEPPASPPAEPVVSASAETSERTRSRSLPRPTVALTALPGAPDWTTSAKERTWRKMSSSRCSMAACPRQTVHATLAAPAGHVRSEGWDGPRSASMLVDRRARHESEAEASPSRTAARELTTP